MRKIDLKKYYIEEHIFESFSESSYLLIPLATSILSDRLTVLGSSGYKKGERHKYDYRKEYIPDLIVGEPSPTDYHFLIILDSKLPQSVQSNGRTKLTLMRLLKDTKFCLDINQSHDRLTELKRAANNPKIKDEIDKILNEFVYVEDISQLQKGLQKHLKRNELPMIDYILEAKVIQPKIQELSKKYNLPQEQAHLLSSLIENGTEYVLNNLSNIKSSSLSYLDLYGGIVYLHKPQDEDGTPEIRSIFTNITNTQHLNRIKPIIEYFQKEYLPIAPPAPKSDTDFEKHFLLFQLDQDTTLDDEVRARIIFGIPNNKPCGKTETNKIASMRRNLNPYLV